LNGKALINKPKKLLKKDKDPIAIKQELTKDLDSLMKVPGLASIVLESASSFL
jgi:hypothetical protein